MQPLAVLRIFAALLLVSCWFFAPAEASPLLHARFLPYDVGGNPSSVAIGDLNGDGQPDLAVANHSSNSISVLLGNGGGTFGTKTDFGTGGGPCSVAIGDLNGDGRPDLAVANSSWQSNTVSVLLGVGDGTFGTKTDFGAGSVPSSVGIGDLNGDGRLDLVVANSNNLSQRPGDGSVSVLLGVGDGTFGPKTDFGTGKLPNSVVIGDLNGDGRPDLAVANAGEYVYSIPGTVSVLLGEGDGTFASKIDFETGENSASVAIGDLDGDGRPDLAVANLGRLAPWPWFYYFDGTVSVLHGNGDGTFRPRTNFETGDGSTSVAIGDLNGDRRPDLAVANNDTYFFTDTISVLLGNGNGTFTKKTDVVTGSLPVSVAIGELNGDGRPDLAVANAGSNAVSVLIGNGDGTFGPKTDFGAGSVPCSVALGDLNGDGRPDLAVANSGYSPEGGTVSVLRRNADGTFGPKTDFGTGEEPNSVAVGDLNGDGRLDLAVANTESNTVSVLLGVGNATFGPRTDFGTGNRPHSVAIGDLNGDRRPDLAVTNTGLAGDGNTVSVLLGNGAGIFRPQTVFGTGNGPTSVAIGDLNGDGRLDLAVANAGRTGDGHTVSVLLGNGDGTFSTKADFGTASSSTSVAIGDLSGDGRLDLAVANFFSSTVSVLLGNGDGTFGTKTDFGTGSNPCSVAIGDLNGDGRPDLAVTNRGSNTVSVLLAIGNDTFGPKIDFGTGSSPYSVAMGDLSGDGRPDLAVANQGSNTVSVLLNLGATTPIFLSSFALVCGDEGIEARWTLSSDAGVEDLRLTASRGAEESWEIPIARQGSSAFVAWDRAPELAAGGVVRYTLLYRETGRGWVVLAEQSISLDSTPRITRLLAPYPNPANPRAVIPFMLAGRQHVRVTVHDAAGREVARLDGGELGPGAGQVVWWGEDTRGRAVASGVYVVRLVTRDGAQTRKLVVAK